MRGIILSSLGLLLTLDASAVRLQDIEDYSYDVRFTNPVCREYRYKKEVYSENGSYIFIVRDNGVGFRNNANDTTGAGSGFGLMSIIERIESINGSFDIKSEQGKGTEAKITIQSLEKERQMDKNTVL